MEAAQYFGLLTFLFVFASMVAAMALSGFKDWRKWSSGELFGFGLVNGMVPIFAVSLFIWGLSFLPADTARNIDRPLSVVFDTVTSPIKYMLDTGILRNGEFREVPPWAYPLVLLYLMIVISAGWWLMITLWWQKNKIFKASRYSEVLRKVILSGVLVQALATAPLWLLIGWLF